MANKLTSIEEARTRVLAEARPLAVESRPLADALGMVVGEEIVAPHSVPPFDNSGMDGFAVRAADTVEATAGSPVRLIIGETIAAGHVATRPLGPDEAARIMTGAPVPEGADAVVEQEVTEEADGQVLLRDPVKPGRNIRRAGEDVGAGERVLAPGSVLGPAEIGLIASLGYATVQVHRRPRVAIISTGSELVEVGRDLGPGQIRNSNSYSLRAQCQQLGIEPIMLGIVPDDYDTTRRLMEEGLKYDVLLTSGGVSVGKFDFVKDVQDELGVERRLWGVAMKPGKPLAFGVRDETLVFGLPGNPVSVMVSFELFVRPALLRLMGLSQDHPASVPCHHRRRRGEPRWASVRGEGSGLAGGWRLARQFDRRSGIGHLALDGGSERTRVRPGGRPGRAGRRRSRVPAPAGGSGRAVIETRGRRVHDCRRLPVAIQ